MAENNRHEHPLQHNGQSQVQRLPRALDPAFFRVDERTVEDLLEFSWKYAAQLDYVGLDNEVRGSWQGFLEHSRGKTLAELEAMPDTEPHFALFLCFLRLFTHAQDQLNTLTQRHLEYYYEKVLQIRRRKPRPDQVHLVFELAKNASTVVLKKGTQFKAGKDADGKPLYYQLLEDSSLNRARIDHLRTVLFSKGQLHVAKNANTADGQGEPPASQPFAWPAMGHDSHPAAPVGMAIAAPILRLSGGNRNISVLFSLNRISKVLEKASEAIQVYATGEKGWIGPLKAESSKVESKNSKIVWRFDLESISSAMDAIVPYDPKTHEGNFNCRQPMLRLLFDPELAAPYLQELGTVQVQSVRLEVNVDGFKDLELLSSEGPLDPKKTFAPFGDIFPGPGSQFFIDSEEVFSKPLQQIRLNMQWQGKPAGQSASGKAAQSTVLVDAQFHPSTPAEPQDQYSADIRILSGNLSGSYSPVNLFQADGQDPLHQTITIPPALQFIFEAKPYYQVNAPLVFTPKNYYPQAVKTGHLALNFSTQTTLAKVADTYKIAVKNIQAYYIQKTPYDGIRLTLRVKNPTERNASFKPKLTDFSLSYKAATAEENLAGNADAVKNFPRRTVQFFHIDVFGQREAHGFLQKNSWKNDKAVRLLAVPETPGNLFIGLQNLEPGQGLSLFFQMLEGSANPEKAVEEVEWSVLTSNYWHPLDEKYLLSDQTNGLLKSGILRLLIPQVANLDNTLHEPGFIWLRATVQNNPDAICRIIDVQAQGVLVEFQDNGNHPGHLNQALVPETISKLAVQLAQVKKITQPYPSFGGRPEEPSPTYYTRVAERLRHKQRAVSIWDYERLVLEQFPEVFQVKCISHCSLDSEAAPGHITLIVIPDYRNYTAEKPLEPKLPLHLLDAIRQYIKAHNMPGVVDVHVQNPMYEQIFLDFKVAFRKDNKLEFGINRQQLNADIIRLLSPWANATEGPVAFDGRYYRSALIYALEKLDYVDYVSHFNMFRLSPNGDRSEPLEEAAPTRARAMLIPAPEHNIQNAEAGQNQNKISA